MRGLSISRFVISLCVAPFTLAESSYAGPQIVQHFAKAGMVASLCPMLQLDRRQLREAMAVSDVEFRDVEPDGRYHEEMLAATAAATEFIEDLSVMTNKPVAETACFFGVRAYGPRGSSYAGLLREK